MLWDPEHLKKLTYNVAVRIFTREEPSGEYAATIKTPMEYRLAIKHVGIGIIMKWTALEIQAAKEVASVSNLAGMNQAKVAVFVRVQCGANYQTISNVLRLVWAFSIALDASICQGTSYVDIRVRFIWQRKLFNLHVISVIRFGLHTGVTQFEMLCKLLDVLSPRWKQPWIGASSDGPPKMTGAISGVITRLQQAILGGFYRVWCLLHQLDISLQTAYQKFDQGGGGRRRSQ
ncbi:unnamed protein product [Hyaloperonospora brassicae]|uniref:RxLR effector candidate protein n=1 Tax=Hyaloperonospora brassicae TaxID=162125 RepID=A0AAV0UPU4_HYABA|nr:unnamed protein product [Hyaloperonospora brassicae]